MLTRCIVGLLISVACLGLLVGTPGCSDTSTGAADDESDPNDTGDLDRDAVEEPRVPELAPITAVRAEQLGAYARRLTTASDGADPRGVAWSMVNQSCQDRAFALQYAIASADPDLEGSPPPMVDSELTVERLSELAESPTFGVASINVAGPLVTYQSLVDRSGAVIPGDPLRWYWAYHHGVVVNVDGTLAVLDLSVGDAPIAVEEWLRSFVPPDVVCRHATESEHSDVWTYWSVRFVNLEPPPRPALLCAYTVTPIFTFRWDQTVEDASSFVASIPSTMSTQLDAFDALVQEYLGVEIAEVDRPFITSVYEAHGEWDVCDWVDMDFCEDRP